MANVKLPEKPIATMDEVKAMQGRFCAEPCSGCSCFEKGKEAGRKEVATSVCTMCPNKAYEGRFGLCYPCYEKQMNRIAQLEKEKRQAYDQGWKHGEDSGKKEKMETTYLGDRLELIEKVKQLERQLSDSQHRLEDELAIKKRLEADHKSASESIRQMQEYIGKLEKDNTRLREALEKIAVWCDETHVDKGKTHTEVVIPKIEKIAKKALAV